MTELTDHSKEAQLQVRWLGKVRYRDALAIQQIITSYERGNYLLLLEHHPWHRMFRWHPYAQSAREKCKSDGASGL